MPSFPFAVSAQPEIVASVGLQADKRSDQTIRYLTDEQHNASRSRIESKHQVEEY